MYLKHFLSGCSLYALLVFPAVAAEPLLPRAEIGFKGGTDRSLLTTEFWGPLSQKDDRVLYGDIRLMGDNDENREGNLGIGYRQIVQDYVLGGHAWIDRRRTQNNSTFHQLTFGVERLGHVVDMRANMYVPLNNSRNITTSSTGLTSLYLAGNGIYYDTNGFLVETPQYGLDGEIGYRIPIFQKKIDAVRIYGGGYHFFRNETENVTGFRIRTEAQINKAISIGARFQHDGPRGSQGFLEATLKFPFSAKKLYQTDYLRSRLDESPERDVDIVTEAKQVNSAVRQQVINSTTGQQQRVLNVDNTNTNPGDGSKENPFNSLKAAEAVLQDNDIIYVNYGTGTTSGMDQGIILNKSNVQLIGSGSNFVYDSGRFTSTGIGQPATGMIIAAASAAPTITNTQTRIDDFTGNGVLILKNNALVSGISITGTTNNGINAMANGAGEIINQVTIQNVTTNINARRGILVYALNGGTIQNALIENSTSNGNLQSGTGRGIDVRADGGTINNATLTGNTTLNNVQNGIVVNSFNSGLIENLFIDNNHSSFNGLGGIAIGTTTSSKIDYITVRNNTVSNNVASGIGITADVARIENVLIENNISRNGANYGIYLAANNGSIIQSATVHNNESSNNAQYGLRFDGADNGRINNFVITNNLINANTVAGIGLVTAQSSRIEMATISGNNVTNSVRYGVLITTGQTSRITAAFSGNTITGNSSGGNYYGLSINHDSTGPLNIDLGGGTLGSTGGNRIHSNAYQDIFIDSMPGPGSTAGLQIKAQHNYWGNPSGLQVSRRTLEGTSTIDATNFLTQ